MKGCRSVWRWHLRRETRSARTGGRKMLIISQVITMPQIESVQELLREYTSWAFAAFGDNSKEAPTFQGLERELASLPGIYAPPAGRLLLAAHKGEPAGCIALKRHDSATAEIKRLYVRPALRGLNIGRQLVSALVEEARQCGYERLVLDSHISMTSAHQIYRAAGFRMVPAPAHFPDALKPIVVFMERMLE